MIEIFSAGCGRRNSARRALPGESVGRKGRWGPLGLFCGLPPGPAALPGESVGRKGIGYPIGGFPTPKAFPSGGRCPSAHTGADEGAILYPAFPCRKEDDGCRLNDIFLPPRWATRSPPHPSPPVTASPQGEASGSCSPTRKKRPKSGHVHGPRNSPTIGTMCHNRQNQRVATSGP